MHFLNALGWALVHSVWQLALVGAVAWGLLELAGEGRPRLQYAIAFLGLLACLGWPLSTFLRELLTSSRPLPPVLVGDGPWMSVRQTLMEASARPDLAWDLRAWLQGHLGWAVLAWSVGMGAMTLLRLGGWLRVQGWRREAWDAPDAWQPRFQALAQSMGLTRAVRLRLTHRLASPAALGLRAVVLVPAHLLTDLPEAYVEALLAHELAHVLRHDDLFNLLQGVIEVLCFHHPVVWALSRRVRTLREHLCDDLAARSLGNDAASRQRLARALNALDDLLRPAPTVPFPALAAHGGTLYSRIHRLIHPIPSARPAGLSTMLALLLPLGALSLRAFAPADPPIAVPPPLVAQLDALAAQEGLDPHLLRALALVESNFNPRAKSGQGARGLLQVMPATAQAYGADNPEDPDQATAAGARYLKALLAKYPGDPAKALRAYACGEKAVDAGTAKPTPDYEDLILQLSRDRAVQPEQPLADGEGLLRPLSGSQSTTYAALRISHRGNLAIETLDAKTHESLGRIRAGSLHGVPTPAWHESRPILMFDPVSPGTPLLVRATDETLGLSGETQVVMDGPWRAFRFTLRPIRK